MLAHRGHIELTLSSGSAYPSGILHGNLTLLISHQQASPTASLFYAVPALITMTVLPCPMPLDKGGCRRRKAIRMRLRSYFTYEYRRTPAVLTTYTPIHRNPTTLLVKPFMVAIHRRSTYFLPHT